MDYNTIIKNEAMIKNAINGSVCTIEDIEKLIRSVEPRKCYCVFGNDLVLHMVRTHAPNISDNLVNIKDLDKIVDKGYVLIWHESVIFQAIKQPLTDLVSDNMLGE